jgi:hypothetical protein
MMGFPYRDPSQAKQFVFEFAGRLKDDPEIGPGWLALKMIVGIHLEQPQIDFWIDARGTELVISEVKPGDEGASLNLTCDLFHRLYSGQENAMLAFVQRKIKPRGKVAGIIQLTRTMPQAVGVYRQFLTEKGLTA